MFGLIGTLWPLLVMAAVIGLFGGYFLGQITIWKNQFVEWRKRKNVK